MTNEFPKPDNEGTPNYYGGGVPNPAPQPPAHDPYGNPYGQPAPQQPYQQAPQYVAPQQFNHPYAAQPYQQQPNFAPVPQTATNKNALISLITSLVTLFILCGIPVVGTIAAIVGIVFGHKGLKETKDVPNSGNGMALAGTICGYLALVASFIVSALVIFVFIAAAMEGSSTSY